ncbi:MAG: response regulator [Methylococcales bacterium]|nr:response regulator [Methylococcales bacterium]MBT7443262.1 response regulator [Methylococcales bacterium]
MKNHDLSRLTFLVVDDLNTQRDLMKSLLWEAGITKLSFASDGQHAIQKIAKTNYDVILCDYNLGCHSPNGQQIFEESQRLGLLKPSTIFIMVTAEPISVLAHNTLSAPDDYISKPINTDILCKRIDAINSKKQVFKGVYTEINRKRYDRAISLCDKMAKKHKKYKLEFAKIRAGLCYKTDRIDDAKIIYTLISKKKNTIWAELGLAKVALRDKSYDKAILHSKQIIEQHGTLIEAYHLLAEGYTGKHLYINAQNTLENAIQLSPHIIQSHQILGQTALQANNITVAIAAYKQAIKLGKNLFNMTIDDQLGLARAYMHGQHFTEANAVLSSIAEPLRSDGINQLRLQIFLCHLEYQQGHISAAKQGWKTVQILAENFAGQTTLTLCREILDGAKLFKDTQAAMALGIKSHIVEHEVSDEIDKIKEINKKGIALYEEGCLQEALEYFEKAVNNLPDNTGILLNYVQLLLEESRELGFDDESLADIKRYLRKVKQLDPSNRRRLFLQKALQTLLSA